MEALLEKERKIWSNVERLIANTRNYPLLRRSYGYYRGRLDGLIELWNKYNLVSEEIDETVDETERNTIDFFKENRFEHNEEKFYEYRGELNDLCAFFAVSSATIVTQHAQQTPTNLIKEDSSNTLPMQYNVSEQENHRSEERFPDTPPTVIRNHSFVNLPPITLPKFGGDYRSWASFRDLFISLIDSNSALTNVQKLHYLKMNLVDDAELLLRSFSITEANYGPAWTLLKKRFENKRVLVNSHLKTLMSYPSINTESALSIKKLLDTAMESLESLKALKIEIESWDPMLIYVLVQKLPTDTHQRWEQSLSSSTNIPTLEQLTDFLEARFRVLEAVSAAKPSIAQREYKEIRTGLKQSQSYHITNKYSCRLCNEFHGLRVCPQFLKMNYKSRSEYARKSSCCFNCLAQSHVVKKCISKESCRQCGKRHHTLLHPETHEGVSLPQTSSYLTPAYTNSQNSDMKNRISSSVVTLCTSSSKQENSVLIPTAMVHVCSVSKEKNVFRALIDPASQATFITERAVQTLGLRKIPISTRITGLARTETAQSQSMVRVRVQSRSYPELNIESEAIVLRTLTDLLPSKLTPNVTWLNTQNVVLADPSYSIPARVDLVLGGDLYPQILVNGTKKDPKGNMVIQNTIFGWIITGITSSEEPIQFRNQVSSFHNQIKMQSQIEKFWEIEEIPRRLKLSADDVKCETIFQETHSRREDGRYVVRLPFVDFGNGAPALGASKGIAFKRLALMENRFRKNSEFHRDYENTLSEYVNLQHMEVCQSELKGIGQDESQFRGCYLPHHAVLKAESDTTKLRVVFDASCKSANGISLNDMLLTGPALQNDIMSLLTRWRKHRFVFTSDMCQMYRQIHVSPEDADYQRILWRKSSTDSVQSYRLLTVTFGTASAPYLAMRTLKQLAQDEGHQYPKAVPVLLNDVYVDDVISGGDNLNETKEKQDQLIGLLRAGKFELRKWTSNSVKLLERFTSIECQGIHPVHFDSDKCVKALGIYWSPVTDHFIFKVGGVKIDHSYTKRTVLSFIAKFYDPFGWIAPIIITSKVFMQRIWLSKIEWDEQLPEQLSQEWRIFVQTFSFPMEFKIPRWLGYTREVVVEIHGFCDASEKAYAAVIYTRIKNESSGYDVKLLASKTRVAPLKIISIPRLELCGAYILCKLLKAVTESLDIETVKFFGWTDSEIVLAWLNGGAHRWKTFVATRVAAISEILPPESWKHVSGKENPADLASRGVSVQELQRSSLWWNGPEWLGKDIDSSKVNQDGLSKFGTDEEIKTVKSLATTIKSETFTSLLNRCSSLNKLLRITAYVLRFCKNCQIKKEIRITGLIQVKEYTAAQNLWAMIAQKTAFASEVASLRADNTYNLKSKLSSLYPFLDHEGLLRVSGRLSNAQSLSNSQKHPVILPSNHPFTHLLVAHTHQITLHGNSQLMLNVLRKRFWIVKARDTIRRLVHSCITCTRFRKDNQTQLMGTLPSPRVSIARPFSHVGVDYAGPVEIRASKYRGVRSYKGYIAIFVCLSTKAVHIEPAGDLTTDTFLATLKRFISRRGLCKTIYSDCGTNFVGASKILDREFIKAKGHWHSEAAAMVAADGIQWNFIPPASPHFGGLWEAGVKSMKYHLRRILGNSVVTFEEMSTLLAQIEACLNSRPLCPLSEDPSDMQALTPGHFLIGEALCSPPEPEEPESATLRSRWSFLQKLKQNFWRRWSQEYLAQLQQRPKWITKNPNIEVGDLVLIKDERLPPLKWLMGRITQTHPGRDNLTRVVTVRTPTSEMKRPITKICRLPVEQVTPKENDKITD